MFDHSPVELDKLILLTRLVFVTVFVIDAGFIAAYASGRLSRRWSLVDVWFAGQVVLVLTAVAVGAVFGVLMIHDNMHNGRHDGFALSEQVQVAGTVLSLFPQNVLLAFVPLLLITAHYREKPAELGIRWRPSRRELVTGFVGGLGVLVLGLVLGNGQEVLLRHLLPQHSIEALERLTNAMSIEQLIAPAAKSAWLGTALFLGGTIMAPVGEELFFRGLLYNSAKRRLGVGWGALLSAAVFALVHGGALLILAILPMGLLLAWSYERTRSLWVTIVMHATNNGIQLLFALWMASRAHG